MTPNDALSLLIAHAPSFTHTVERRLTYYEGKTEERFHIFTQSAIDDMPAMYSSASLPLVVSLAIASINEKKIELSLTCP